MEQNELDEIAEKVDGLTNSHRLWVLPILKALVKRGGSARPKDVESTIRELYRSDISDLQFAHVLKGKHIRWSRNMMSKMGLIGGEYGTWAITERGKAFLESRSEDVPDFSSVPAMSADEAGDLEAPLDTVVTTRRDGFEVPLLRCLAEGISEKQQLLAAIEEQLENQLLPGDLRVMPGGSRVVRYRTSWALSELKAKGHARNVGRGAWEITEAGRERLRAEGETFNLSKYQDSKCKVRGTGDSAPPPPTEPAPAPADVTTRWQRLRHQISPIVAQALQRRLRPDLEATPTTATAIPRNVIFYGPPGTGKTHLAKLVARALTGEAEPGPDSSWRVVQFHPSYAYEDFVQGLRPDLEHSSVRYQLIKGPFLLACEQAEQDQDRFYVLIIDEINRGDPARIFGELLYALEYRGEPVDLALGGQLTVPPNLVVIGTMNSVDRSVALVDYALRRRFAFVRLSPTPELILELRGSEPAAGLAAEVLDQFNQWITAQLDQEHAIGHSIFLNPAISLSNAEAVRAVWENDVLPLLEEYFFGDQPRLQEAAQAWKRSLAAAEVDDATASTDAAAGE